MPYHDEYLLEFVGGPYDGYFQCIAVPQENLLEAVGLPVNRNVLQVIKGEAPGPDAPTRTVAAYELHDRLGKLQYVYCGSRVAGEVDWEKWCTKVCQAWQQYQHPRQAGASPDMGQVESE